MSVIEGSAGSIPAPAFPRQALLGVLLAIAVTTALDATGYSSFSALPLFPIALLCWWWQRLSRREIGLVRGTARHYALAIAHPVLVMGALAGLASLAGAIDYSVVDWTRALRHFGLVALTTFVIAILTEEGFFRGWLWGTLHKAGLAATPVLVWSSVAFALWHVPAVLLQTSFAPPLAQVPVLLANVLLLGIAWGLLRAISGSIIVASCAHGVWNGLAYVYFGFGEKVGALGIANTTLFGPEVGVLGLLLNAAAVAALWTFRAGASKTHPTVIGGP